jgi:hypothetical protein
MKATELLKRAEKVKNERKSSARELEKQLRREEEGMRQRLRDELFLKFLKELHADLKKAANDGEDNYWFRVDDSSHFPKRYMNTKEFELLRDDIESELRESGFTVGVREVERTEGGDPDSGEGARYIDSMFIVTVGWKKK